MKIKITILLMILMFVLPSNAMSGDSAEGPTANKNSDKHPVQKNDDGFITEDEAYRIAVNFYHYMFEEEFEWKGICVDSTESVIMNITPFVDESVTFAYMVNYKPDGHVLVNGNKNLGSVINRSGDGTWPINNGEKFINIDDKRINFITMDWLYRMKEAVKNKTHLTTEKNKKNWDRFLTPLKEFNERFDFINQIPPPKWWLEKKKALNQTAP